MNARDHGRLNPDELEALLTNARAELVRRTASNLDRLRIGEEDSWDAEQETGIIRWLSERGVFATAQFQVIGTFDDASQTFLWGWDHPSLMSNISFDAKSVYDFGMKRGVKEFTQRKVSCDEDRAWDYTAFAASLLGGGRSAYRGVDGSAKIFMTYRDASLVK